MNEMDCLASGGHKWGSPIAIVNPPEFRICCEKCHKVEVMKPTKEGPPKKRDLSITWRDWFKSARHIGSTRI